MSLDLLIIAPLWRRPRRAWKSIESWLRDDDRAQILVAIDPADPDAWLHYKTAGHFDCHVADVPNALGLSSRYNALVDEASRIDGWSHLVVMGSSGAVVGVLGEYGEADAQGWTDLHHGFPVKPKTELSSA